MGWNNFEDKIGAIFPAVGSFKLSPFHGMTDILLHHRGIGAVAVCEPNICCIEVGTVKTPTCSITIGGVVRKWPQKLGEVLASMYLFGALNYVNSPPKSRVRNADNEKYSTEVGGG